MNWNLRTLRTRILSRAEVVEHFVPVHSELEHKTVEHFDPEHKTVEHMDPGPLQKLPRGRLATLLILTAVNFSHIGKTFPTGFVRMHTDIIVCK